MNSNQNNKNIKKKKNKCFKCLKKTGLNFFICKYCNHKFCSNCINLEIHICKFLDNKKNDELNNLKKKLENEKYVSNKFNKI